MIVTSKYEDNKLTIYLSGRVDTSNAQEVEDNIKKICKENVTENVVLDVLNLEYISSAGLRVVLRLKKDKPELCIFNASKEIFDIFEMTGFTEMIRVEKTQNQYKEMSIDGCPIIAEGAKGIVYRVDDDVVKVYKNDGDINDALNEKYLAKKVNAKMIPTAIPYEIVTVGGKYATRYELLDAKTYSELLIEEPENFDKLVEEYADLLKEIHGVNLLKGEMPDGKRIIRKWISTTMENLNEDEAQKLKKLVDDLPDKLSMLHLDYHTNNVMKQGYENFLIDMDTVSHGHPMIELGVIYSTYVGFNEMDPNNSKSFLHLDSETAKKFWEKFIVYYLGTEDEKRIKEVEDKARFLSYCRIVRYTTRNNTDKEAAKVIIDNAIKNIRSMINDINTLEF